MKEDIMKLTEELSNKDLKNLLIDVLREIGGSSKNE